MLTAPPSPQAAAQENLASSSTDSPRKAKRANPQIGPFPVLLVVMGRISNQNKTINVFNSLQCEVFYLSHNPRPNLSHNFRVERR